jgi:hypothetical protein
LGEVRSGFFEGLGLEGSKIDGPDRGEVAGNGIRGNLGSHCRTEPASRTRQQAGTNCDGRTLTSNLGVCLSEMRRDDFLQKAGSFPLFFESRKRSISCFPQLRTQNRYALLLELL